MMEPKGFISSINFKLKNERGSLVSFNIQSIVFRLSFREIQILLKNDKEFNRTKISFLKT